MSQRPCTCDRMMRGGAYTLDQCRLCWLFHHDAAYRAHWGGPPLTPQAPALRRRPCVHLGAATGETVICSTCPRDTTPPAAVYACAARGKCAPSLDRHHEVTGCGRCSDRQDKTLSPLTTRHLLYHLCPFSGNGAWQHNVKQLMRRRRLFNGKVIVAICTGGGMDEPAAVWEMFNDSSITFLEISNNPSMREVETFLPLFESLLDAGPDSAALYAHSKGVTRPAVQPALQWADVLYETCMDYWPHVARLLARAPVAGCMRKIGQGWPAHESYSHWHYSGSWFWFRPTELFAKADWRRIDRFWSGIESYPSLHWDADEAACIFYETGPPHVNLYDWKEWQTNVLPALYQWRVEHAADLREWRHDD